MSKPVMAKKRKPAKKMAFMDSDENEEEEKT